MKSKVVAVRGAIACLLGAMIAAMSSVDASAITQLSGVVSVAVGNAHTCAVKSDGNVLCWGDNEYGKLGIGRSVSDLRASSVPVLLPSLASVALIAAGPSHTCALKRDATVWCWGKNSAGQLGNSSQDDQRAPVLAVGLPAALSIHAGAYHSCAITTTRAVYCWGSHYFPSLIDGRTDGPYLRPTLFPNLNDVVSLGLGTDHSCAVLADGSVKCWGSAYNGVLGIGATTENYYSAPQRVVGIDDAVAVAAGASHSCVARNSGKIACWGYARNGIVGPVDIGVYDALTPNPVPIKGFARAVATRYGHSCAVTDDGSVRCWGSDGLFRYLGTGANIESSAVPLQVRLDAPATAVAVGQYHSCAIMQDTTVKCWGVDNIGSLGLGRTGEYFVPSLPQAVLLAGIYPSFWVASSASTLSVNDAVVLSSQIEGRAPSGTMSFLDGSTPLCTNVPIVTKRWDYLPNNPRYEAFCNLPPGSLQIGEHRLSVAYSGDSNFVAATSPAETLNVVAGPALLKTMVEFRNDPLDYYFMTSRANEVALIDGATNNGWSRTGASFQVFATDTFGGGGLTRFYFDRVAKAKTRGSHFYTVKESDRAALRTQNPGNESVQGKPYEEGIDSYVVGEPYRGYIPQPCYVNAVEVYRLFRNDPPFVDDANHRFTTDYGVVKQFVTAGWRFEGAAFCAPR